MAIHTRTSHPAALVAVKVAHTAIFASLAWAVLYTFCSGLTGRTTRKTGVAVAAVLLGLLAGVVMGDPLLGLALLLYAALNRMTEAMLAGWSVVRDPLALRYFWLYPIRDLMGFFLWCASFFNTSIVWRGERYQLQPGGKMVRQAGAEEPAAPSETVAVDELA